MNDEQKLLTAYRASDARGKASILDYATSTAEDWPEVKASCAGAVIGDATSFSGGQLDDFEPPPVIGAPE